MANVKILHELGDDLIMQHWTFLHGQGQQTHEVVTGLLREVV